MDLNKLRNIITKLYQWEDNPEDIKLVLVDIDNYETKIDGIYFDEKENKLYINSKNGCNYSNIFKELYRRNNDG